MLGVAATREDNFGSICEHQFRPHTITATSETTAVVTGKVVYVCMGKPLKDSLRHARSRTTTASFGGRQGQMIHIEAVASFGCDCSVATPQAIAHRLKDFYPEASVVGFDNIQKGVLSAPAPQKQKTKRKKSAFLTTVPVLPQHPGVALAVAAILVLTGAGWLLGERPRSTEPARG